MPVASTSIGDKSIELDFDSDHELQITIKWPRVLQFSKRQQLRIMSYIKDKLSPFIERIEAYSLKPFTEFVQQLPDHPNPTQYENVEDFEYDVRLWKFNLAMQIAERELRQNPGVSIDV